MEAGQELLDLKAQIEKNDFKIWIEVVLCDKSGIPQRVKIYLDQQKTKEITKESVKILKAKHNNATYSKGSMFFKDYKSDILPICAIAFYFLSDTLFGDSDKISLHNIY